MAAAAAARPPSVGPPGGPLRPAPGGYSRGNWFFWSDWEKENLAKYKWPEYRPLWHQRVLTPLMERIAQHVPGTVAPNVLTLAGLICLTHALFLAYNHASPNASCPFGGSVCVWLTTVACSILVGAYYVFDYIDGIHARRTMNESNLGSLLVSAVNASSPTFLVLIICLCLGITDARTQWYAVQSVQLFFLFVQIRELHHRSRASVRWFLPGPAAIVPLISLGMLLRVAAGISIGQDTVDAITAWIGTHWRNVAEVIAAKVEAVPLFGPSMSATVMDMHFPPAHLDRDIHNGCVTLYVFALIAVLAATICMPRSVGPTDPRGSRWRILICVMYRVIPATMMNLGLWGPMTLSTVLVDGLFIGVLITDLIVSKMAQRCLHPWVVLMCMGSVMDQFVELMMCVFYHLSIFYDLSAYMQLPMFTVVKNVYVDGVWDLCHIGHKNAFQAAAKFGNGLIVGVVNDEDAAPYKRPPVMSHAERCREVQACKYVSKVVPNAPCNGIPESFIREHNIHVVVCGQEYDKPDDKYYAVPRAMGIVQYSRRTQGISTSELIKRIKAAKDEDLIAKDKQRGESTVTE